MNIVVDPNQCRVGQFVVIVGAYHERFGTRSEAESAAKTLAEVNPGADVTISLVHTHYRGTVVACEVAPK